MEGTPTGVFSLCYEQEKADCGCPIDYAKGVYKCRIY